MAQDQNTLAALVQEHLGEGPPFISVLASDTTKVARCIREHLDFSRQAVIRMHPWNFAIDRSTLELKEITNAVSNGGPNLIRLTVTTHGFSTGNFVTVSQVQGTSEANGQWTITVIDPNTIDLQDSVFTNTYVSGGLVGLAPPWGFEHKFAVPSTVLRLLRLEDDPVFSREGDYILTDEATLNIKFVKDITDYSKMDAMFFQALALHVAWTICYSITNSNKLKEELGEMFDGVIKKARYLDSTEGSRKQLSANLWVDTHQSPTVRQFVRDPMT